MKWLLFLLFSGPVFALSEEELTMSILKNFPLIQEADLKVRASEAEVTAAEGGFDHKLTFKSRNRIEDKYENQFFETTLERQTGIGGLGLMLGHRQGLGNFPAYDGKYETSGAGEIFAGITLPILRNFRTDVLRTDLAVSQLQEKIAQAELQLKKNIYLHQGLSIYYKWLFSTQKIKIREEVLKIAQERQLMLEQKFKAGDIERLKLTDNQRSIDKRQDELAEAKIEWEDARTKLSMFYRDDKGAPLLSNENIFPKEDIVVPKVTSQIIDLPQIIIIENELKIREVERKFWSQSQLPGLNLELVGARELSGNQPYDPSNLQVGVKFDFPLENRKAEGKTTANEYKWKALERQRIYAEQELRRLFNFSLEAIDLSKKRWEFTSGEFEKTTNLAKAERTRWNQGASDLYIVNLREQDTAEADIKRWKIWLKYHQYLLDARLYSGTIATHP